MANSCDDLQNLGTSKCKEIPKLLKGWITTSDDYTITAALAETSAQWQTDIKADINNRIYLWPQWGKSFEDVSSEQVVEETPLATMSASPGNHRWKLGFTENLELHKAMYSHRNTGGRVFPIDIENKIISTSDDDGVTLKGLLIDNVLTEKLKLSDGTVATKTLVGMYTADNTDLDQRGFMTKAPFVNSLIPLTSVVITVAASPVPSATTWNMSVASALDGVPIIGLTQTDFLFLTAAGANQDSTITTILEPLDDGDYVVTGVAMVTGTINLVLPSVLSLDAYESKVPQVVTIV